MAWWRKERWNPEREQMLARLRELQLEDARTASDFIMYAEIGKDRHKLGMEWAKRCEQQIESTCA